jgi:hypothetical protein
MLNNANTNTAKNFTVKVWGAFWDGTGLINFYATEAEARIALRSEIYSFLRATDEETACSRRTIDFAVRGEDEMFRIVVDRKAQTYRLAPMPNSLY